MRTFYTILIVFLISHSFVCAQVLELPRTYRFTARKPEVPGTRTASNDFNFRFALSRQSRLLVCPVSVPVFTTDLGLTWNTLSPPEALWPPIFGGVGLFGERVFVTYTSTFDNKFHAWLADSAGAATWQTIRYMNRPFEYPTPGLSFIHDSVVKTSNPVDTVTFEHAFGFLSGNDITWKKHLWLVAPNEFLTTNYSYRFPNDSIVEVSFDSLQTWIDTIVPKRTKLLNFCDTTTIIAVIGGRSRTLEYSTSRDAGRTWSSPSTIVVTNSQLDTSTAHPVYGARQRDGYTIVLSDGRVLSTSDCGESWIERGSVEPYSSTRIVSNNITRNYKGALSQSGNTSFSIIPPTIHDSTIRVNSRAVFSPTVSVSWGVQVDSAILMSTLSGIIRSSDLGATWSEAGVTSIAGYEGILPLQRSRSVGRTTDGKVVRCVDARRLHILEGNSWQIALSNTCNTLDNIDGNAIKPDDLVRHGLMVPSLDPGKWIVTHPNTVRSSSDDGTTWKVWSNDRAVFAAFVDDTTMMTFVDYRDSLRMYSASGVTVSADSGLPRAHGKLSTPSTLTRLHNGTLLLGFRGLWKDSTDGTTADRHGGIYRSTDGGRSWHASGDGLGDDNFVYSIAAIGDTVIAAASRVSDNREFGSTGNPNIQMSTSRLYRSVDAGRSWTPVFEELYSAGLFLGSRRVCALGNSSFVHASTRNGLMMSMDAGQTWQSVYPEKFLVSDIDDIHTNEQEIIVASDSGTFVVSTPTTVVHNDRSRRYLDMSLAPVPANENLYVDCYNIDLGSSRPTLTIWDTEGRRIADLSSLLTNQPDTRHVRLTIPVTHLHRGVYILHLDGGSARRTLKFVVSP